MSHKLKLQQQQQKSSVQRCSSKPIKTIKKQRSCAVAGDDHNDNNENNNNNDSAVIRTFISKQEEKDGKKLFYTYKYLTRGFSIRRIETDYPTLRDVKLRVIRILALQRLDDFHQLRRGEYGLSIGGSSMGELCGTSPYKTSIESYNAHVFPEQCPQKDFSPEQQRCLDLGNKYEKIVRTALEQFTRKKCYNGGFLKVTLPFLRDSYEMLHVSPDGFLLSREPPQSSMEFLTPEYVQSARGDPQKVDMLSKLMLPLDAVEGVCEFKVSVYAPLKRIPPNHVIQCCFQSMVVGDKPCHYVNLHIKDDVIIRMVYAIITPQPYLKTWLLGRLETLITHMIQKVPLPDDFQYQMIEVCNFANIKVVYNGSPENAKIDRVANMSVPEEAPFW